MPEELENIASASSASSTKLRYFGDYELLEEIARGGMGVVYRARQISVNRIVAVKLLAFGQFASDEFVRRFRFEAEAAAGLGHPNIVAIHEVGEHKGQHFFSMDYIDGKDLAEFVRAKPLPSKQGAALLQTVAEAIHFAHRHGVLHRDLKPSNVLIDANGKPHVTDFGLAKRLDGDSGITVTGQILGSPNYMPPEQADRKRGPLTAASDIYSLGAILYHLLTGRPPFVAETIEDTLLQLLNAEPVALRLLNASVPRELETICLKCLSKNPLERYSTAEALADDLNRFLQGEPIVARPLGAPQKFGRWCRRKPALASALALLTLLAIGATWTAIHLERMRMALGDSEEQLRKNLYASALNMALRHWEEGNTVQAHELLTNQIPLSGQTDLRGFEWRYLFGQCRGNYSFVLPKQQHITGTLLFSSDGTRLAAHTWNNTLTVWDVVGKQKLFAANEVSSFGGFSPDSTKVVLSRGDGGFQVCEVATGSTNRTIAGHGELVALAVRAPVALVLNRESELTVMDSTSGQVRFKVPGSYRRRTDYGWRFPGAISPDGKTLALIESSPNPAQPDRGIQLRDLASQTRLRFLPLDRQIRTLAFAPESDLLAIGDGNGRIFLWSVRGAGSEPIIINAHRFPVLSLAFSADGQMLASGSSDKQSIRLWRVADGTSLPKTFSGQIGDVWSLAFSPEGRYLAAGTRSGPVRVWDLAEQETPEIIEKHVNAHEYGNFIFSPDSQWMAAGCESGIVKVWEVASLHLKTIISNATYVVAFSKDSRSVLVSTAGGSPRWETMEAPTARSIPPYHGQVDALSAVDLTSDRRVAALGLRSGAIQLLDIEAGRQVGLPFKLHEDAVRSLAFSPKADKLASGGDDNQVVVVDVKTGAILGRSSEHKGSVCAVAIAPDGQLLASGCGAETIKFWHLNDISTGSMASISYHKSVVRTLAFSPDQMTLASGSEDCTVKLWSVPLRSEVASFKLEAPVVLVVFSPDGQALAAVTEQGTLRILRAPSLRDIDNSLRAFRE